MAGRKRCDEHFLRIVAGRIAPERRVGAAVQYGLAFSVDFVIALVGGVAASAFAGIAGPAQMELVVVFWHIQK